MAGAVALKILVANPFCYGLLVMSKPSGIAKIDNSKIELLSLLFKNSLAASAKPRYRLPDR
jgi:hypothetical protein